MQRRARLHRRHAGALAAALALACVAAPSAIAAPAEQAFALSDGNLLVFDPAAPATVTTRAITGVTAGETLVGIDVRPQNGMLYGLGVNATANTATLYVIGRETGQAGVVGTASAVALTTDGVTAVDLPAEDYGFDVNPSADRIRVTTASGLNFRINPLTGAAIDGGGASGTNPDLAINGATTSVSGAAYTNDQPNNGNITTLYALSAATDQLTIQNPPNNGSQTLPQNVTLGGVPINFSAVGGFDIDPAVTVSASNVAATSGAGYAVLAVGATTHLYRIALADGAATDLGPIGAGTAAIQGLALQRDLDDAGFPAIGLAAGGLSLIRFATATPGTATTVGVGSITSGETMVAIAWRPQTGQLYGLGVNATANTATLYLLDPGSGATTVVGGAGGIAYVNGAGTPIDFPPATAGWGIDVNPTVDRIRIVADGGLNARVNPNTGAPVDGNLGSGTPAGTNPDAPHNGLPPGATGVTATAYTNAYPQSLVGGVTTQYALEPTANQLLIQDPPTAGTLKSGLPVTLAGAPLDFAAVAGLDIPAEVAVTSSGVAASGSAIAALTVGGTDGLYRLDLATGAATLLGTTGAALASLAVGDAQRDIPRLAPIADPGTGTTPPATTSPLPVAPIAPFTPIDTLRPRVTRLAVTATRKRRLTITFTASEPGTATIRLVRETKGRRQGSRCVATRRTGRRCTISKAYGSITRRVAQAGTVTVTIPGKVGTRTLALGALRVEVRLRDAAGNASTLVRKGASVRR